MTALSTASLHAAEKMRKATIVRSLRNDRWMDETVLVGEDSLSQPTSVRHSDEKETREKSSRRADATFCHHRDAFFSCKERRENYSEIMLSVRRGFATFLRTSGSGRGSAKKRTTAFFSILLSDTFGE